MDKKSIAKEFLDIFEDKIEDNADLSVSEKDQATAIIDTREKLEEGLVELRQKNDDYKQKIDDCDRNIKMWQESKKLWQNRSAQLLDTLGRLLQRLHVPGLSMKAGGVKLATSTRTVIEADEEWLIGQYQALADSLQSTLPGYIKVKLTVDKTKLAAHLKDDNSLLLDHPDKIHTRTSSSTTIK